MPSLTVNGRTVTVDDSFLKLSPDEQNATVDEIAKSFPQQAQQQHAQQPSPEQTDTSLVSAVQQGAANVMQGVGSTIKNYISKDAGAAVEGVAAAKSNPNYKSASQEFARPSDGADKHFLGVDWASAPRALIEQAPALASDLLTQMVLRKAGPLVKLAGGTLTYGARTAGNEAQKRADARTGETGSEPSTGDKLIGLGSTAAQGALNAYGAGKIVNPAKVTRTGLKGVAQTAGNVAKAAGAEGATNAAQEAISDAAATAGTDKGLSVDSQAVKAAGLLGAVGGGVFGAGRGVRDVAQASNTSGSDFGEHSAMAANRIVEKAGSAKALENPETAFSAVKGAQANVKTELSDAAKAITAPSRETANALVRAKQGSILTENELSAIDAEGNDQLSSLVRQQNALGKLTKNGSFNEGEERFAGGLSETIRNHSGKLASVIGGMGAVPHFAANGAAGLDSMTAAIPGIAEALAGGYAGYRGLKALERFAGVSSPARSFAEKFADETAQLRPPVTPPELPEPSQADLLKSQHSLESGLQKMVDKLQGQKRQEADREAREAKLQDREVQRQADKDARLTRQQETDQQRQAEREAREARQRAADEQRLADREARTQRQQSLDAQRQASREAQQIKELARAEKLAQAETLKMERQQASDRQRQADREAREARQKASAEAKQIKELAKAEKLSAAAKPKAPPPVTPGVVEPKSVDTRGATPKSPQAGESIIQKALAAMHAQRRESEQAAPQDDLPDSPYWHMEPNEAADHIFRDEVASGKEIDYPKYYRDAIKTRLEGEEAIYNSIAEDLPADQAKQAFHRYLSAMWGSDSPTVMRSTKAHMLAAMPEHAAIIEKHLTEEAIKKLWEPKRKKKKA